MVWASGFQPAVDSSPIISISASLRSTDSSAPSWSLNPLACSRMPPSSTGAVGAGATTGPPASPREPARVSGDPALTRGGGRAGGAARPPGSAPGSGRGRPAGAGARQPALGDGFVLSSPPEGGGVAVFP